MTLASVVSYSPHQAGEEPCSELVTWLSPRPLHPFKTNSLQELVKWGKGKHNSLAPPELQGCCPSFSEYLDQVYKELSTFFNPKVAYFKHFREFHLYFLTFHHLNTYQLGFMTVNCRTSNPQALNCFSQIVTLDASDNAWASVHGSFDKAWNPTGMGLWVDLQRIILMVWTNTGETIP